MGAAAAPLSMAATGLSAAGKVDAGLTASSNAIQQGETTEEADTFKAQQLANDAEYGKIQADQMSQYLTQQTLAKLSRNAVTFAAQNVEAGSPTNEAIQNRTEELGDQERDIKVGNINAQVGQDQQAAAYYMSAGVNAMNIAQQNSSNSILGGILGGAGSIFTGLAGLKLS